MKSKELIRLIARLGGTFREAKGSHLFVRLNGRTSVIPRHNKELPIGLLKSIKKDLGIE